METWISPFCCVSSLPNEKPATTSPQGTHRIDEPVRYPAEWLKTRLITSFWAETIFIVCLPALLVLWIDGPLSPFWQSNYCFPQWQDSAVRQCFFPFLSLASNPVTHTHTDTPFCSTLSLAISWPDVIWQHTHNHLYVCNHVVLNLVLIVFILEYN